MTLDMKKSIFFLAGIMGLGLAACEDTSDLGTPQVNEKPIEVKADGITAKATTLFSSGETLDLGKFVNLNVPVLDVVMDATFPETSTLQGTLQLSDVEEFDHPQELPITLTAVHPGEGSKAKGDAPTAGRVYQAVVDGNLIEDAFVSFYGKAPFEKPLYYRYELFIVDGSQTNVMTNGYTDSRKLNVLPVDLKLDLKDEYFIYGASIGGNSPATAIKMTHSDKHKYDDPIFSYICAVNEDNLNGYNWVVCDGQSSSAVSYGVADPTADKGALVPLSEGGKPGMAPGIGGWKVEINMLTKTYTVTLAADHLYVYGGATAGSVNSKALQLYTSDYIHYQGLGLIRTDFKLASSKPAKDGAVYGKGAADGELFMGDVNVEAIAVPKANGIFWFDVDVVALKYTITECKSFGICGSPNDWGNTGIKDIALKPNSSKTIWTGEFTTEGKAEFKFRADNDWAVNFGGSFDDLIMNNQTNLTVSEAGTYSVTLDFSKLPYTAKVEKK